MRQERLLLLSCIKLHANAQIQFDLSCSKPVTNQVWDKHKNVLV